MEQQDKKISQMAPLQTVSGDEIVPVVKSGGNYSALVSQIVALARQTMVEAQAGKGLSANDFTDALKAKLEGLSNYDDTEVRALITAVSGRLDTILGDGASTAIDTFNEIEAFLAGITDTQTLTGLLQQQKQTITNETDDKLAGKVDKVSGKGLSANDYTNEDKAKLTRLLPNGQFGYTGHYGMDGKFYTAPNYANSGLVPVNRNFDIEFAANVGGSVASVVFYTADKRFIKAVQIPQTLAQQVLPAADIPEDATFFIISTASPAQSYYRNGLTIESREGAMAEALASLGKDKLDKEKWDEAHEQYTIKGYYLGKNGVVVKSSRETTSVTPFWSLNKAFPITLTNVLALNSAIAVAFYDAAGSFISYPEAIQNLNGDYTIQPSDFPENAVFFRGCTERTGSSYSNGPSIESREGAVSEAIQAAKLALFIDEFNAAAGSNGKYDPVNAPDPQHPFYLNTLWLTYEEAVVSMAHINEIYLRGGASMSGLNIRTNMLAAKPVPTGWGAGFVYLNGVCLNNSSIEVLNVRDIVVDSSDNLGIFVYNCPNLHTIIGQIDLVYVTRISINTFAMSPKLQEVRLYNLKTSINFKDCPLLSIASLQYIVDTAANTAEITVTVHPVTYGKLTDEQADIMALLPENLTGEFLTRSPGATAIENGVEIATSGTYFSISGTPRLVNSTVGKMTLSCDVEGLQDGESIALLVGSSAEWPRPTWTISANGRAVFSFNCDKYFRLGNNGSLLLYDGNNTYTGQGLKLTNFKLSYGEHDALPYTPPLSSITDAELREKAEWLSLMQIAEARQINFITTA